MNRTPACCRDDAAEFSRRRFLRVAGVAAAAVPLAARAATDGKPPETLVKSLYDSLTDKQRGKICFDWNYQDPTRGLLRTRISNNWLITEPPVKSGFFTAEQQAFVRAIFEGLVSPDWIQRFDRQFKDDMGGFGLRQSIALFGRPGEGPFEFVMTGRHGTIRCDGNSADHVAFGGPIMYGHAASGYFEEFNHPGNVFWHQSAAANDLFKTLDGAQRERALLAETPDEARVGFRAKGEKRPGIAVRELSSDQKARVQEILRLLIEPYRQSDRDEAVACLKAQGGLDECSLAFYKDYDLGNDGIWDNWRLEGPAFVWHYRGAPHVHVWVHVADDPSVALNAKNDSGALRPK
jgi:hypothetical protein